ncbi:MAG: 50S ribosomal protein L29 [Thermotogae bacterium]|nr:50S ribosomal protein L29 [Thermotogaceae bacterium]RKX35878.1 MAG: 50S ribosomal protein L29 [Thermotogota bacterium]
MKISEIRNYTNEELLNLVEEKKKQLMEMRFQHAMGQIRNTAQLQVVKRDIARIKTILRERELGIRR